MILKKSFKTIEAFETLKKLLLPYLGKQVTSIAGVHKSDHNMTVNLNETYDIDDPELIILNFEEE